MSMKVFNKHTGKWELNGSSQALEVSVVDLENNFESKNVEGCLRELNNKNSEQDEKITLINDDFAYHLLNHPSGGGTGGGGSDSYVTLSSDMDRKLKVSSSSNISLVFDYDSSVKRDGTATITVNNILKNTSKASIGKNSIDVTALIGKGSNEVILEVSNMYGVKDSIIFVIDVIELTISSSFDYAKAYSDIIQFPYSVKGSLSKTMHFVLNGTEIGTDEIKSTNTVQKIFNIPKQSHGVNILKVYATSTINDEIIVSNAIEYEVISIDENNTNVLIASSFKSTNIEQYSLLNIPFIVYNPSSINSNVTLKVNDEVISSLTVNRTEQIWNISKYPFGDVTFTIQCGEVKRDFVVSVSEVSIDIDHEINGLELYLTSSERNNSDVNKDIWEYNGIRAIFNRFNWIDNGWILDDDGFSTLKVNGDSNVIIPFKPFEGDCKLLGKTIEFEFKVTDVIDYEAVIIDCFSNNKGFKITCKEALFSSNETISKTSFKENEKIRVSFAIEPLSSNKLIYTYINGIISGITKYTTTDNFIQTAPVNITIGSNKCTVSLYTIRIYDNCIPTPSVLKNYIYDINSVSQKIDLYNKNNIYNEYDEILYTKILDQIPCMSIIGELPDTKGDLKNVLVKIENKSDGKKNLIDTTTTIDVQGTSSQYYPKKNYLLTFTNEYKLRDDSIASKTFCIKADYMESSHTHNTGMAKFINSVYSEKVPPQISNAKVRTTIDGYPVAIFYKEAEDQPLKYYGIYNFNNDKSTGEVFGYENSTECWEVCNNTSQRCLFNISDYSSNEWMNDFTTRYPAVNTDYSNLKRLTDWLAEVKDDPARFKEELKDYMNVHYTLMYYVISEMFAMVDSRAKNLFIASWDKKIWYPIFYDMDTCLGLNNEGVLSFDYNVEYHDTIGTQNVFNAVDSSLWNNIELNYKNEISELYRKLRNNNVLTYDKVLDIFVNEQITNICEAQYNEDAKYKYLDPLLEDNISTFLYIAQGNRINHFKYWLFNRFNYMDSKYLSSDYRDNYATLRLYTPTNYTGVAPNGNFEITPYANQYVRVKYGSYEIFQRGSANTVTNINAPDIVFNDTETIVYGASRISSLGDLSSKYAGTIDVSKAVQLNELIIGSNVTGYTNTNLRELSIGNNKLLRRINVMNCPNLSHPLDVSGCDSLEEFYAEGTSITSVQFSGGSNLKIARLPGSIINLSLINKPNLTELFLEGYDNINLLRLEDTNINPFTIIQNSSNLEMVRLININCSTSYTLLNMLKRYKGMDSQGVEIPISQAVSGKINIVKCSQEMFEGYKEFFPHVEFTVTEISKSYVVTFKDGDGNTIYVENVVENGAAEYVGKTPTKTSTAQYDYTFKGWDRQLKPIISDCTINATFNSVLRYYTIRFINSDTDEVISSQYLGYGSTPTKPPLPDGFNGWSPIVSTVTVDMNYYTRYFPMPEDMSIFSFSTISINGKSGYSCSIKSVSNLPSFLIIPFEYNGRPVVWVSKESSSTSTTLYANIKEVYIPDTVSSIITTSSHGCFQNFSSLTSITIPNSVTSIGTSCFSGCSSLTSITIPNSVTSLGTSCFYGCSSLTSITIPDGVTSLGNSCFSYCNKLPSIIIPDSVTSIGSDCFYNCSKLTSIEILRNSHPYTTISGSPWSAPNGSSIVKYIVDKQEDEDFVYSLNEDNESYTLMHVKDKTKTEYTIPENINGKPVTSLVNNCFQSCTNITSIEIPNSVTSIGNNCFQYCTKLTSINMPNSVTSIGTYCFQNCYSLTSINISNNVTSLANNCFQNCTSLTSITIPNSVTSIGGGCFGSCSSLTSIIIPNSVTSIGDTCFYGCTSLTSITIKGITSIPQVAFHGCSSLKLAIFGSKNSYITSIYSSSSSSYQPFYNCSSLSKVMFVTVGGASLYITNTGLTSSNTVFTSSDDYFISDISDILYFCNTTNNSAEVYCANKNIVEANILSEINGVTLNDVYLTNSCFSSCSSLTSITIPNSVASIGTYCFESCSSLTSIEIPNSVTSIGERCFQNCSKLTSIKIPDGVTSLGTYCFYGCSKLTSITIPDSVTGIGTYCFRNCSSLASIQIKGITSIPQGAFYGCSFLNHAVFGSENSYITSIYSSSTTGNQPFYGCPLVTLIIITDSYSSLSSNSNTGVPSSTKVYFSTFNADRVYEDENAVYLINTGIDAQLYSVEDKSIVNYTIPNTTNDLPVTSLGSSCFKSCSNLTTINIPDSVTSIGASCFNSCSKLTSITIPYGVTSLSSSCFSNCSKLTSITIPNSVTSLGYNCFNECSSLTSITIPNSVTSLGSDCFYNCTSLPSINIPNSVTSIGSYCFYKCSSLTSITIPNGVTSLGNYCFYYCSSLTLITIPNSVTSIGSYCFYQCTSLPSITIPNSVTSIGSYCFQSCYGLISAIIGNSVINIGISCFYGCSKLSSINLPNSVTTIGGLCFYNCSVLATIQIGDISKPIGSTSSWDSNFMTVSPTATVTIYTATGDNTGVTGQPWGGTNCTFVYEQA